MHNSLVQCNRFSIRYLLRACLLKSKAGDFISRPLQFRRLPSDSLLHLLVFSNVETCNHLLRNLVQTKYCYNHIFAYFITYYLSVVIITSKSISSNHHVLFDPHNFIPVSSICISHAFITYLITDKRDDSGRFVTDNAELKVNWTNWAWWCLGVGDGLGESWLEESSIILRRPVRLLSTPLTYVLVPTTFWQISNFISFTLVHANTCMVRKTTTVTSFNFLSTEYIW